MTGRKRPPSVPEGIVLAQLDGAARNLLHRGADMDASVVELRSITPDPRILGTAAGHAIGAWRRWKAGSPAGYDGDRVAELLVAAGADPDVMDVIAGETERRLERDARRPGIGMPTSL